LAISKERKEELVAQYQTWAESSKAMILTEYIGLTTKEMDELRRKIRETGGEFHIVKNTLTKLAFNATGHAFEEDNFKGTSAIGFAFEDAPSVAKAISDFAKTSEFIKIKGGYLGSEKMTPAQVTALADLPPLPVIRASLLGTLMAPANNLVRVLAEPGRRLAQVMKAYSDQEAAGEAA
jgi:large subunit ribosomal protein L10